MLQQLQDMQAKMAQMQEEAKQATFEGTAGGGAISVTVDGEQAVTAVKIEPEALEDAELLADMIVAACNDALRKSRDQAASQTGQLMSGLNLPPGIF